MFKVLLIVPNNSSSSYIHVFPMGTAYIASSLQSQGHEVIVYNQDQYHYPEEHLTKFIDENNFDVVGIGTQGGYYQYKKLLLISNAINKTRKRPLFVLGGHIASPEPEYFLRKTHADIVVIGEGERTIVELLDTLQTGLPLSQIKGIAFLKNNKCIITEKREPIQDLDSISKPA